MRIDLSFSDYWVLEYQRMREQSDYRWGDYYLSGGRKGKKSWVLELIHTANQMIPTFNELFDEVSCECPCVVLYNTERLSN